MIAQTDMYGQCTKGLDITESEFTRIACSQCASPECVRSRYTDSATQAKIRKTSKLAEYRDPNETPPSPLSAINRVPIAPEVESGEGLATSLKALRGDVAPPSEPATLTPATPPPAQTLTSPASSLPVEDPWAAPDMGHVDLHKEYDIPEQDPWSPQYQGPMSTKAKPGTTFRMRGKRK